MDLIQVEKLVLQAFQDYHVTLPEAVFIFEKIKFSSMHHAMTETPHESLPEIPRSADKGMFR